MTNIGNIVSVNVGTPRTVTWGGRVVSSAIWKSPQAGRVRVEGVNLTGDDQADRRVHGGPDKAVYAYASEDYEWWTAALGTHVGPATFGENLTTVGLDLGAAVVGQRWRVGSTVLEVAQPRSPCFKLGMRMGDAAFVDRFNESGRTGAYLRIIESGDIGVGDAVEVGPPPAHALTVAELYATQHAHTRATLERLVSVDDVPAAWREWADRRLARLPAT